MTRKLALLLLLLSPLMIIWLQRSLLFVGQFDRRNVAPAPRDAEAWSLETDEGPVEAWFLPGRGVTEQPGPVVVFAHGNGERIGDWPAMLAPYRELGLSVVLPEYRGYGNSAGKPTEAAIRHDLHQLVARLRTDPRVDPTRIVYHGRSLGTGALGTLLASEPPRALIFESGFRSLPALVWENYRLPRFLIADSFDTESTLLDHARHKRSLDRPQSQPRPSRREPSGRRAFPSLAPLGRGTQ